jgi:hypothetical protein
MARPECKSTDGGVQVVAESLVPTAVLLCQDPVAAVRHAAAAECAAMAAHLFSCVGSAAHPSGPAASASTAGSALGQSAAASGAAEVSAEAGSVSGAEYGETLLPASKTGTAHEATPALLPAEREPPDEPDQGQVGEVLSSLLRRLKTDLAHSRSFRSRHSFVVVCQHILGAPLQAQKSTPGQYQVH